MTCKARSHACASDSPRLKRDTVQVAPLISASSPTTTTPPASSQPVKRCSSAVTKSWISTLVLGSLFTCCLSASASVCPPNVLWISTNPLPTGRPASVMKHMRTEVPFGQGGQTLNLGHAANGVRFRSCRLHANAAGDERERTDNHGKHAENQRHIGGEHTEIAGVGHIENEHGEHLGAGCGEKERSGILAERAQADVEQRCQQGRRQHPRHDAQKHLVP